MAEWVSRSSISSRRAIAQLQSVPRINVHPITAAFTLSSYRRATVAVFAAALAACDRAESSTPLFELLRPDATGIAFVNELPESPEFNILNYLYYYNGGGVA